MKNDKMLERRTCKDNIQGFTLLELSIVLVIIGLLVGGILVGRDLIHAAEVRSVLKQLESYDLAVQAFRLKYNCLPGDCAEASALGVGVNANSDTYGGNGNGDGLIGTNLLAYDENFNFWFHLSSAHMIRWTTTLGNMPGLHDPCGIGIPCAALQDSDLSYGHKAGWAVLNINDPWLGLTSPLLPGLDGNVWWLTANIGSGSDGSAALFPADAYALDAKRDDGLPMSGNVRAASDNNYDPYGMYLPTVASGGRYVDACVANSQTPNVYNVMNYSNTTANLCSLVVKAGF